MCPLEYRVQRLFQRSAAKLLRPRLPISERARKAYDNRAILLPMAGELVADKPIRTCGVKLAVSGHEEFRLSRALYLTLSHFLPIFKGAAVQVWPEAMEKDHLTIDLTAHLMGKTRKKAYIKNEATLLDIEFTVYPYLEQMEMVWLKGNPQYPGYAGKALPALYNLARDLRLARIYYYVDPKNINARRFYFHMDFGRPIERGSTSWEVNLREKEGSPLSARQLSRP